MIRFSTEQSSGLNPATPNDDYDNTVNSSIIIRDGETSGKITISIVDDPTPELDETFNVVLEGVELIGGGSRLQPQLGDVRNASVTILENDDARGKFVIKAKDADSGTFVSRITVPENDSLTVYFTLERLGGTLRRAFEVFAYQI